MVESNMRWLRKIGLDRIRASILAALAGSGILDTNTNIDELIEDELYARAVRIAEQGQEEEREMASRTAILQIGP